LEIDLSPDLYNKLKARNNNPNYERVKVEAPSSTANLGPGFDVFGLALDLFHDTVEVELAPEHGLTMTVQGVDHEQVSKDPEKNTAGLVANIILTAIKSDRGLKIKLTKRIPVGKGLGSSAASAAACVLALNRLFNLSLNHEELVALAGQGEIASAGTVHFDNVAAATLGGFVIVSHEPFGLVKLAPPRDLEVAVAVPNVHLHGEKTKKMRDILPKTVPFRSMITNISHASLFVAATARLDIEMMGRAMSDVIVEPVRSKTVPIFTRVKRAAIEAGAVGVAISGAGPTIVALCNRTHVKTGQVAHAMKEAFEKADVTCEEYTTAPSNGAKVID
jgi:homoserine kinase